MTGDVPYYGGRLTPAQAYAASHSHAVAPPRAAGPVQVLVVHYRQPDFSGEVLTEIARLEQAGLVVLVDLVVVRRDEHGEFETVALPPDVHLAVPGAVEALLAAPAIAGSDVNGANGWSLVDVVPLGATVAIALIEHRWAASLRAAVRHAGGAPVDETWLAAEDLVELDRLVQRQSADR
jgi:hypothetical protein